VTPIVFAWLLSFSGAGLFFAAGEIWGRQRRGRNASGDLSSTIGAELEATRAHMMDQERAKQELRAHETQLSGELSQRRSESEQLRGELTMTHTRTETLERELASARAELRKAFERTAPGLGGSQRPSVAPDKQDKQDKQAAALEQELMRLKREHDDATEKLRQVEAERDRLKDVAAERDKLAMQLELAHSDTKTVALQQELSLTRESLTARNAQLEQLREETVRLHSVEKDLERAKRELGEFAEQTRLLRAEAYASHRPPAKRSQRPATISTRGDALQLIVDDETEHGGARSAVIADELGLVVASSGEYGDALAAFGAYLADVGTRTRDVLPLQEVRQVVVRDDHDMTLTVRPLATEDPGLALVTLAIDMNTAAPMQDRLTRGNHASRT
jgi:chromosome segregation ATPase